jgi:CubicO group peptidase (beta-lactamase class C family)
VSVGVARGLRVEEGLAAPLPVAPDTLFPVMSASKGVVALAVAVLEDRGLLDIEAPVARVFPEFSAHGKGAITVLDVLTHRSGLLMEGLVRTPERWSDWDAVVRAMADAVPEHPRGGLAYESHAFGWVLGEVVRRVSGKPLPDFLSEVLGPELPGLHFLAPAGAPATARPYWLGAPSFRVGGVDIVPGFEDVNDRIAAHSALVPGAGMRTTARALADVYGALAVGGVTPGGRRLLRPETLARYTRRFALARDRVTGAPVAFGLGFGLGWALPHPYGWWGTSRCFGHGGGFGVMAFADPERALGVAVVTNGHRSVSDLVRRCAPVCHLVRAAAA